MNIGMVNESPSPFFYKDLVHYLDCCQHLKLDSCIFQILSCWEHEEIQVQNESARSPPVESMCNCIQWNLTRWKKLASNNIIRWNVSTRWNKSEISRIVSSCEVVLSGDSQKGSLWYGPIIVSSVGVDSSGGSQKVMQYGPFLCFATQWNNKLAQ